MDSWINTRANQVWKTKDFLPLVKVLPDNKSTTSGFQKQKCWLHLILGTLVWRCCAFVPKYLIIYILSDYLYLLYYIVHLHNTENGLFGQSKSRPNQNWEHLLSSKASALVDLNGFFQGITTWGQGHPRWYPLILHGETTGVVTNPLEW